MNANEEPRIIPDPKASARGIERRARKALKSLERTNRGKYAEVALQIPPLGRRQE